MLQFLYQSSSSNLRQTVGSRVLCSCCIGAITIEDDNDVPIVIDYRCLKKTHIFSQFYFKIFFVGNNYKFCYEFFFQEIATNFLAKYFI